MNNLMIFMGGFGFFFYQQVRNPQDLKKPTAGLKSVQWRTHELLLLQANDPKLPLGNRHLYFGLTSSLHFLMSRCSKTNSSLAIQVFCSTNSLKSPYLHSP